MQSVNQPAVPHAIHSSGVDWLTATTQKGESRWNMRQYADSQRRRLMDSDVPIRMAYRLGFGGWQCEGFFYGERDGCSMIVASGAVAHNVFRAVSGLADNISRLDLQTTVSTLWERPHLGVQAYQALKSGLPSKVKVKNVTLITSHPQGETCNIGKRSSDRYGRIYDKATEAGMGEARSLWRYEVEFKRHAAHSVAAHLRGDQPPEAVACALVHTFFDTRGVAPIFEKPQLFCPQKPQPTDAPRDVLTWFEESLSITVAKAIKRHGLSRVLEALNLAGQVDVKPQKGGKHAERR